MSGDTAIQITPEAAKHIQHLLDKGPEECIGLRLSVKSTGCSGHSYEMEYVLAGEDTSGDETFEQNGAQLYISRMHSWMLFGMTIDYASDELGNTRFSFINPNETSRCGCGESFHVSREELEKSRTSTN